MPTVTITLGATANGSGYGPGSQAASPDKLSIHTFFAHAV